MESAQKTEGARTARAGKRKTSENDSDEELEPPSPIHIAPEAAMVPEFDFPDPQELRRIESDTQNRLKAILEVAGVTGLSQIDARTFQDPEILRKLTNSVSTALDEAATALTRMKTEKQNYEAFLRGANQAPSPSNSSQLPPQPSQVDVSRAVARFAQEQAGLTHEHPQGDGMQAMQRLLTQGQGIQEATEDGESLLSLACSAGYYELAEVLLRMRASVEDRGIKGDSTPLMEAASGGYADIVKLLIDHGANVNATSSVGNTALTYACCGGYEDVVRILLEAGADVEHQNENGHTPLMEAASCGHVGVAKLLLDYGANINTHSNEFKESALTLACYKGHLEMVKFLLGAGADQEHKTDEMHTALMEASMDGHVDVAKLLLDHGAQVNMPVDSFESPLTLAACGGHYELAALLISRGADLEEVNDEGYTPLMEAAREGHEDVVQLLVEHAANVNAQTEETQETALTLACCGGFLEVAQYLIDHGADIEAGASTPLMEAAQEGHVEIVKFLLEKGANIHADTNTGDTALTYASANGHTAIADILLQCGANLNHESEGGRTPLMKAARAGHLQTVQFLISKGADINRRTTTNDHTVLSLACAGGHVNVVQYLLMQGAEPSYMLRDNSSMLIEASRGGHTAVASLILRQPRPPTSHRHTTSHHKEGEGRRIATGRKAMQHHQQASQGGTKSQQKQLLSLAQQQPAPHLQHNHIPPTHTAVSASQQTSIAETAGLEVWNGKEEKEEKEYPSKDPKPPVDGGESPGKDMGAKRQKFSCDDDDERERGEGGSGVHSYAADPAYQQLSTSSSPPASSQLPSVATSASETTSSSTATTTTTASSGRSSDSLSQLPDGVDSEPYLTPEEFLRRYWLQQIHVHAKEAEAVRAASSASTDEGQESSAGPGKASEVEVPGELSLGKKVPLSAHAQGSSHTPASSLHRDGFSPKFHASSTTANTSSHPSTPSQLQSAGTGQPEGSKPPSSDISQLIPQLEALANSLQNPTAVETAQYIAALTQNQMLTTLANAAAATAGQFLTPGTDDSKHQASVAANLELINALASNSEMAKYLPTLASIETQTIQIPVEQLRTIYGTDLQSMKALSQKVQTASDGYDGQGLGVDALHDVRQHSLSTSFLLDGNFPLDIPPPSDLIPEPLSGYVTSEEDEEDEEDGSDSSSYLAQDHLTGLPQGAYEPAIDINQQTDSNHDTALTLAAAGGHDELVELLLAHGGCIEHRDKKGCTPLILAASAGHAVTVAILLDHNADIEAQSDRTKDTALSLACSGGRQEVVELLLSRGANFEHRNVSDYTPLSLAASGGYVNIIKLLLRAGADINSRTGSKLGISPLMLAAMNGHSAAVKLLLDMGSDINAQIETNRNTALTLACFQGRHEVVGLLVERQANVEHRAKTGLTPLMEAASGGYHEVGKVLICKGADVNAAPVPSSRDTALTIAADKGHYKFVDLIIRFGAHVDVKNKKGNSPLWLACNGGHLDVVCLLVDHGADVDSQDNRKVSCLMAAFRKGHYKVVKYLVNHVSQFPSDAELTRYISTFSDKDLLKKCRRCMEVIIDAKERQAAEANKNATILLQEIDLEKKHEEDRKAAAARKRAKKKRQKEKKQALKAQIIAEKEKGNGSITPPGDASPDGDKSEGAMGGGDEGSGEGDQEDSIEATLPGLVETERRADSRGRGEGSERLGSEQGGETSRDDSQSSRVKAVVVEEERIPRAPSTGSIGGGERGTSKPLIPTNLTSRKRSSPSLKATNRITPLSPPSSMASATTPTSSPRKGRKEDGWKEVGRRTKKVVIPTSIFAQVVGKNCCNLVSLRHATNTHIEVDKQSKQSPARTVTIRGSADAIKQAHHYITILMRDPSRNLAQILPKLAVPHSSIHSHSGQLQLSRTAAVSGGSGLTGEAPSVATLDTFDEPSDTLLSKSTVAISVASMGVKTTHKKDGALSTVAVSSGSSKGQSIAMPHSQSVAGGKGIPAAAVAISVDRKTQQQHILPSQSQSSMSDHKHPPPVHVRVVTTAVVLGTNSLATNSKSISTAPASAVRRLFASSTQAATQSTVVVTATQTMSFPPQVASSAPPSVLHMQYSSASSTKPTSAFSTVSSSTHQGAVRSALSSAPPPSSVTTTFHSSIGRQSSVPSVQRHQSEVGTARPFEAPVRQSSLTLLGGLSPKSTLLSSTTQSLTYSSVIASQEQRLLAATTSTNVIEQPLQQIMKTPTLFQEPATQLTKPKKKSTYSDAVGKKSSEGSGPSKMAPLPPHPHPHPSAVQSQSSIHVPPKINLAPGSRPLASDSEKSSGLPPSIDKRNPRPWSDLESLSSDLRSSFEEDEKIAPSASNLGPIGPPIRSGKLPSSKPGPGPGNFSPGAGNTVSPTAVISSSPQRGDSSSAKSPLLGTAPPGLLPPPDSKGPYSSSFRPIQLQPADFPPLSAGETAGSVPTLMPTPVRNTRPPLLATPPGFTHGHSFVHQGMHHSPLSGKQGQKTSSPAPSNLSPEKGSPNKSPPHPPPPPMPVPMPVKGFNPNAPAFVPMGLRPANPTTSSILGAPPAKYFSPPTGSSLLGNAPQLPPSTMYNNTRVIAQPVPQPSLHSHQTSILGQPPTPPLNPQIFAPPVPTGQPGFSSVSVNRQSQVPYGQAPFDGNAPPSQTGPGAPQFSINLLPFPSQNQGQGAQAFGTNAMKDSFVGPDLPLIALPSVQQQSLSSTVSAGMAGSEMSKFGAALLYPGKPDQQSGDNSSSGAILLPGAGAGFDAISTRPSQMGGNLINISLGQLGPSIPTVLPDQPESSEQDQKDSPSERQQYSSSEFAKTPGFVPTVSYTSYLATSKDGSMSAPSSSLIVAPGPFTPEMKSAEMGEGEEGGGEGSMGESLLPIGGERAQHKRSNSLPGSSAFSMIGSAAGINPSSVWSYSGKPASTEDSDWSSAAGGTSGSPDWPSVTLNSGTSTDKNIVITPQDNLQSVLERLGLTEFHQLFQSNEIDLDALLLMNEQDFSEIGLSRGPRLKLLTALGLNPKTVEDEISSSSDHSKEPLASGGGDVSLGKGDPASTKEHSSSFSSSSSQQQEVPH